jgi:hypothetical protein
VLRHLLQWLARSWRWRAWTSFLFGCPVLVFGIQRVLNDHADG